jgi:hypothetical protein
MLYHNVDKNTSTITFANGWKIEHILGKPEKLVGKLSKDINLLWTSMDIKIKAPTGHYLKWSDKENMTVLEDICSADDLAKIYTMVAAYTDKDLPFDFALDYTAAASVDIESAVNRDKLIELVNENLKLEGVKIW